MDAAEYWQGEQRGAGTLMGSSAGYVRVRAPEHGRSWSDGRMYEHVKVLLDAGIDIPDGYQVHHINGVRHDNRLENLEVLSIVDHAKVHAAETRLPEEVKRGKHKERMRRNYQERRRIAAEEPERVPHGLKGYRNYGCKCDTCKDAYREYRGAK